MRAERTAKRAKSHKEGEDALATADNLVDCTGKEQSAGDETTSKDASIQTDPVLLSVDEGYIRKNKECSCVFLLPVFTKKQQRSYVAVCLSFPSYTCASSANNFTTCLEQNVNSACCFCLQRCKAVSHHNH